MTMIAHRRNTVSFVEGQTTDMMMTAHRMDKIYPATGFIYMSYWGPINLVASENEKTIVVWKQTTTMVSQATLSSVFKFYKTRILLGAKRIGTFQNAFKKIKTQLLEKSKQSSVRLWYSTAQLFVSW